MKRAEITLWISDKLCEISPNGKRIFFLARYPKFLNPVLAKNLLFILIIYKGGIQASLFVLV